MKTHRTQTFPRADSGTLKGRFHLSFDSCLLAHIIDAAPHDDLGVLRVELDVEDDPAEDVRDGELRKVVVPPSGREVAVHVELSLVRELGVHLYGLRQLGIIAEIIWDRGFHLNFMLWSLHGLPYQ